MQIRETSRKSCGAGEEGGRERVREPFTKPFLSSYEVIKVVADILFRKSLPPSLPSFLRRGTTVPTTALRASCLPSRVFLIKSRRCCRPFSSSGIVTIVES